jgi:hypothetical protein
MNLNNDPPDTASRIGGVGAGFLHGMSTGNPAIVLYCFQAVQWRLEATIYHRQ